MATQTTNYNLPVVQGTDTVNLLTVLPDLATKVDAQMKTNANTGIQRGTHSKSGTVNSVTVPTELATGTFFTFVASDDFTEGDSFTFNGEVIAARTPEGKALKTGAFTINQNVLCCNYNGILTIFTNQSTVVVDSALDDGSENAIANRAVTVAINAINTVIGNADISTIGNTIKNAIISLDGDIRVTNNAVARISSDITRIVAKINEIIEGAEAELLTTLTSTIPTQASYTVTADGYIDVRASRGAVYINDQEVYNNSNTDPSIYRESNGIKIHSGDIIRYSCSNNHHMYISVYKQHTIEPLVI